MGSYVGQKVMVQCLLGSAVGYSCQSIRHPAEQDTSFTRKGENNKMERVDDMPCHEAMGLCRSLPFNIRERIVELAFKSGGLHGF